MTVEIAHLRVTTPDGQVREHPIESSEATIGAAPGNTIVINHISVSPRHCRLVMTDGRFHVVDHGSDHGTYLNGRRIATNAPAPILADTTLQIGSVEAVLLGQGTPGEEGRNSDGAASGLTFRADLHGPAEPVPPDGMATATVIVENQGRQPDDYTLRVDNQPHWLQMSRATLSLAPGTRDEITIAIRPPRSHEVRAGQHELAISVASREHNHAVRVIGGFYVERFDRPGMRVQPPSGRGRYRVTLTNMGNAAVEYRLAGSDAQGELAFAFDPEALVIEPGQTVEVALAVRPRKRRIFGRSIVRRFEVEGVPAGATATPVGANARVKSRALFGDWRWIAAGTAVLAIGAAAAWIAYRGVDTLPFSAGGGAAAFETPSPSPQPTTPTASPTEVPATPTVAEEPPAEELALRVGGRARVINSPETGPGVPVAQCLRVRSAPNANADTPVVGRLCDGDEVDIVGGPETSGTSFRFWEISGPNGISGWAADGDLMTNEEWLEAID